jgi:hypothetical protein
MGPDHIDHRSLLTDEQLARAMEHQATLLFWGLGWHEPHVDPRDRLADGLRISGIVLFAHQRRGPETPTWRYRDRLS